VERNGDAAVRPGPTAQAPIQLQQPSQEFRFAHRIEPARSVLLRGTRSLRDGAARGPA